MRLHGNIWLTDPKDGGTLSLSANNFTVPDSWPQRLFSILERAFVKPPEAGETRQVETR